MTAPPYDPTSDGRLQEEFVEKWRDTAYGCFSSGHKFCREVCPVMQVTSNENHTPTAFHANIVAMDQGNLTIADVADDYVHCTQCGACELRCPNTLFTGDFYRNRTQTVKVVKAVRALAVQSGVEQPNWKRWVEATLDRKSEPVSTCPSPRRRGPGGRRGWTSRSAATRSCSSTARPPSTAPRCRAPPPSCSTWQGWTSGSCASSGAAAGRPPRWATRCLAPAREHNMADWRAVGAKRIIVLDPHNYISFTEDYLGYFATHTTSRSCTSPSSWPS